MVDSLDFTTDTERFGNQTEFANELHARGMKYLIIVVSHTLYIYVYQVTWNTRMHLFINCNLQKLDDIDNATDDVKEDDGEDDDNDVYDDDRGDDEYDEDEDENGNDDDEDDNQ